LLLIGYANLNDAVVDEAIEVLAALLDRDLRPLYPGPSRVPFRQRPGEADSKLPE